MRLQICALALLAFAAPAAHAADLSDMDCVAGKLDAAAKAQIAADVARNMAESGKRPSYDPVVRSGLANAAAACAKEHGWSPAAGRAAGLYALARIGLPVAQRIVDEHGFDAAALEDRFQALPEEIRNRVLSASENQELIKASVTEESQQTRENAELLAEFFAFLSTIQYASYDFSQGVIVSAVADEPLATAPVPN